MSDFYVVDEMGGRTEVLGANNAAHAAAMCADEYESHREPEFTVYAYDDGVVGERIGRFCARARVSVTWTAEPVEDLNAREDARKVTGG